MSVGFSPLPRFDVWANVKDILLPKISDEIFWWVRIPERSDVDVIEHVIIDCSQGGFGSDVIFKTTGRSSIKANELIEFVQLRTQASI